MATLVTLSFYPLFLQAQPTSKNIAVSFDRTAMLVFPSKIIDADWGNDAVTIRIAKKTPTVLKVKATSEGFTPTNLTVYTEDGMMYMTAVHYDSLAANVPYVFNPLTEGCPIKPVIAGRQATTMQDVKTLSASLLSARKRYRHPAVSTANTHLSLANIWIKDDLLYFQLRLSNNSAIPYDILLTKYYERDNNRPKRTTVVEREVTSYYELLPVSARIASDGTTTLLIVFNKFTIADQKHFAIELFEKNGDRHLVLNIKGRRILKAEPIP